MIEHLSDARCLLAKIKAQTRDLDVSTIIEPLTRKTKGVQTTRALGGRAVNLLAH